MLALAGLAAAKSLAALAVGLLALYGSAECRASRRAATAALFALLATAAALRVAVADPARRADGIFPEIGRDVQIAGAVVQAEYRAGRWSGLLAARGMLVDDRPHAATGGVRFSGCRATGPVQIGAPAWLSGTLRPIRGFHNFDPRPFELRELDRGTVARVAGGQLRIAGPPGPADRLRNALLAGIDRALARGLAGPDLQFLRSAIFGTGDLPPETFRDFNDAGLLHLLVVSGQQVTLLTVALLAFAPGRTGALAAIPAVALYAWLCGADPSIVRAAAMAILLLAGRAVALRADPLNSLFAAFLLLAAADPNGLRLPGFQFTFGITLALLLAGKLPLRGRRKALAGSLAAGTAALPIALLHFGAAPLAGLVATPCAVILFDVALSAAALALPAAALVPPAAGLLLFPAGFLARALLHLAALFAAYPLYVTPAGLAALPLVRSGPPVAEFLDVGQGDAALFRDGATGFLVDTGDARSGAGARALVPHLRRSGLRRLSALFLSHLDADHAGNAGMVARLYPDAVLYLPAAARNGPRLADFLREQGLAGERIRFLARGDTLEVAGFSLTALWPPAGEASCGRRKPGTPQDPASAVTNGFGEDGNAASLVLAVRRDRFSALLTGDLTADSERRLLAAGLPRAAVLKASHHGAAGASTPTFVRALAPDYAVLSAAWPNRYGHPAPATLRTLARSGARVLFTADRGQIRFTIGADTLEVTTSRAD